MIIQWLLQALFQHLSCKQCRISIDFDDTIDSCCINMCLKVDSTSSDCVNGALRAPSLPCPITCLAVPSTFRVSFINLHPVKATSERSFPSWALKLIILITLLKCKTGSWTGRGLCQFSREKNLKIYATRRAKKEKKEWSGRGWGWEKSGKMTVKISISVLQMCPECRC